MKKLIVSILLFLTATVSQGQGVNPLSYSTLGLSDSLKKNANAVYRLDEGVLEVQSPSNYDFKVHQIITILNSKASHHLSPHLYIDKFTKVEDFEVKVYNSLGVEIKKYKKKDFDVRSANDGESLYTDAKVMHLQVAIPEYPVTIETTYEEQINAYVNLPDWYIGADNESVELFRFIVKVPPAQDLRFQTRGMDLKPAINSDGKLKQYSWEVKNYPALKVETGGYEASTYRPAITLSPNSFEYDGKIGDLKSWKSFGEWVYQLFEDNSPFTPDRVENIKAMVASCKSESEKIRVLYDYLKKNMRYVSITLGVGGLKPFPVSFVDEKKYGDCKALTNYMRYMLKAVGIKAYPALINSGYDSEPRDASFPVNEFDHVILCVPMDKDSVWLECTSNKADCGFLGTFTEDKNALLLTENGGVLVPTPRSKSKENVMITKTIVHLNKEGPTDVDSHIWCTGDLGIEFTSISQAEHEDQKRIFVGGLNYKSPEKFELAHGVDSASGHLFRLNLSYEQMHDFSSGSKYFYRPRINNICDESLKSDDKRKHEYLFEYPYDKTDTTIFILPAGYSVDNVPAKKEIDTKYGYYESEFIKNESEHQLVAVAHLTLKNRFIPPADYMQVYNFFRDVVRNEGEKVIIKGE